MFTIQSFFNPHLPVGQTRLDAVLTITSDASVAPAAGGRKVVGFVMDVSGSMDGKKLAQAKMAARAGIEMLKADTLFFVVVFAGEAEVVMPASPATADNKATAHQRIQNLQAVGGTAMSLGLELALQEVRRSRAAIASVYFQTDGDNDRNDNPRVGQVLAQCKGVFQCDCRGIGTDWKPEQLRTIAGALLGTADAVVDPAGLEADFRTFLDRSLARGIAGAKLRLWSPKVVRLVTLKQVSPEIVDKLALIRRVDDKTIDLPLGAWGSETRDYQLAFELPGGALNDEMLACRAAVVVDGPGGEIRAGGDPIAVKWSDDDRLTTRISREVAHYNGQGELAAAIQEGLEAREHGDDDKATRLLGRAARIAEQTGNEEVTRRLRKVVEVVDAAAGTVRLKKADKGATMELEMGATRTVRRRAGTVPADASSS